MKWAQRMRDVVRQRLSRVGSPAPQKKSREESSGEGSGVEILANRPYSDGPGGSGQYTHKIYHVGSHIPSWFRALLPKAALQVEEESWNAYPYTRTRYLQSGRERGRSWEEGKAVEEPGEEKLKTSLEPKLGRAGLSVSPSSSYRYTCPFVEKFSIEIETYYRPDAGKQNNVFELNAVERRQRILGECSMTMEHLCVIWNIVECAIFCHGERLYIVGQARLMRDTR